GVGCRRMDRLRRGVSAGTEFYRPDVWRKKTEGSIKQGSGNTFDRNMNAQLGYVHDACVGDAEAAYMDMLDDGVAPEMARMLLPQSMMTSYVVTANLSGLSRFVYQRSQPDAQKEIQDLAHQVDELLKAEFGTQWNKGIQS